MNIKQKRQVFNKDLNKLVDNKHTVIPNELTWEQLQKISDDPEFFELYQEALLGDTGEDCACLIIKAIHGALLRFAGSH
ncbi:hypothetical protein [Acinetobacter pittii]|uniref:hypothetical protein n=1 Tax=Acinetobacter pittii TaxID=48296 RepID=UPI002A06D71B|nr:hypothetical protein [Acinetobacter pittii]MDX8223375.1 hypothetical protein [Acinetobacter pittii]WPP73921.1 hypothetical protein SOI73_02130 [Acinetobacter pittii]